MSGQASCQSVEAEFVAATLVEVLNPVFEFGFGSANPSNGIDGSNFEMPDEAANAQSFGYPGSRTGE